MERGPLRTALKRPEIAERFWSQVDKHPDGCWLWTGTDGASGYGSFRIPGGVGAVPAHRFAWMLVHGRISRGLLACHHCDVRKCVRVTADPEGSHIFLGTQRDNMADMVAKGRAVGRRCAPEHTKNLSLRIMLTRPQKDALIAAARRAGLDVSTWLRQLGLREAGFLKGE
jgi:HNH endonuclease